MSCLFLSKHTVHVELDKLFEDIRLPVADLKQVEIPKSVIEVIARLFKLLNACEMMRLEMRADAQRADCNLLLLLEEARKIRNALVSLLANIGRHKSFIHMRAFIEVAVSDWDEFVEELTVSGDPEIHDLTRRISHVVDAAAKSN